MLPEHPEPPRAFVTCAARAVTAVAPLVAEAEQTLLDLGWRTRIPRRALLRQGEELSDKRRLRFDSYDEIERSNVVIHVPAPDRLAGLKPHRELQHAMSVGVPIALLVALPDRRRLGIEAPAPARVEALAEMTRGTVVGNLSELAEFADRLRGRLAPET